MLAMPEINYIKHLRENEDLSITKICERIGVDWRTAKKYADGEVPIHLLPQKRSGMMFEEGYGALVDDWLEEDLLVKRKLRRTNKRIFEQLREEHQFKGSYRTVSQYIHERKPHIRPEKQERFERLEHPPGEAQVDFGTMQAVREGAYQTVKTLLVSFPNSNAAFGAVLPAENSECFLEGLRQCFKQAGGIPTAIRIDNLVAAVIQVGRGNKRTYTDSFLRFQAHYGFEIQPCNPASGHEKGNVEKKVGYTRNNFFVTEPIMEDFQQLTLWLKAKLEEDRNRPHYEKGTSIEELWQEELKALKQAPLEDLPIYTLEEATTNKYGEIRLDEEKVLIPKAPICQALTIKKEWDSFTCFTKDGEVVYQQQRFYMSKTKPIPWLEIFTHWAFKTRAVCHSRYFQYLPESIQTYIKQEPESLKKRVRGIADLLEKEYTLVQLEELFQEASLLTREVHELRYFLDAKKELCLPEKINENHTPSVLWDHETDLHIYDQQLYQSVVSV